MLRVGDRLLCKKTTNYDADNKYYIITRILGDIVYFNNDYYHYNYNDKFGYYIWDHFYTPQEVRKMKLERLNKC